MLNINYPLTSFDYNSFYGPITPTNPYVNPYVQFPISMPLFQFNSGLSGNDYHNMGYQWMQNATATQALSNAAQTLTALEAGVTEAKENESLNKEQKEKLQEILNKIETLKKEIASASDKSAAEKNALVSKVTKLQKEAAEVANQISEEIQKAAADGDGSSDTLTGEKPDENVTNFDATTGRSYDLGEAPTKEALRDLNSRLFNAIDGPGTEYDVLKSAIISNKELNAGNIIEVIDRFEKDYGKGQLSAENLNKLDFTDFDDTDNDAWDQTFINRFIEDLGHYEKKEFVPVLLNALMTRAEAAGVPDEKIQTYVSKINNELGDCCIGEKEIVKGLLGIYKEIKLQEIENAKKETKAQEDKKAEKAKETEKEKLEAEEAETEAIETFLIDMREIWKDNELETSDKVKYKDGKFVIRIEGRDYTGKDFNELCDNITKAGYDPKKYLTKQQLAQVA